jgi:hypothetical protein
MIAVTPADVAGWPGPRRKVPSTTACAPALRPSHPWRPRFAPLAMDGAFGREEMYD